MDPSLLKEREAFKKRALANPSIEKKPKVDTSSFPAKDDGKKKALVTKGPNVKDDKKTKAMEALATSYKSMAGSSQYRFGVLTKIVKHMRTRHQEGDDHPLTIDDILDETNQLDVGQSVKNWLSTEALINNPKIEATLDGRFSYKPVYKIRDGKSLIRLLKQHDLKGLGGILLEDVQESLPHCEKVLKNRATEITFVVRPMDKKKVLFYNDKNTSLTIDEEFQKLWRQTTVDAMDDAKIDEYLEKQGIRSMQDHGAKKPIPKRKKAPSKKRIFKKPKDNEHMADVLEVYEDNTLTQKGVNPC